jgi:hypothetical protein
VVERGEFHSIFLDVGNPAHPDISTVASIPIIQTKKLLGIGPFEKKYPRAEPNFHIDQ